MSLERTFEIGGGEGIVEPVLHRGEHRGHIVPSRQLVHLDAIVRWTFKCKV